MLTAADGDGQQCNAAPACTASIELETKGAWQCQPGLKVSSWKKMEKKSFKMQDCKLTNELLPLRS